MFYFYKKIFKTNSTLEKLSTTGGGGQLHYVKHNASMDMDASLRFSNNTNGCL